MRSLLAVLVFSVAPAVHGGEFDDVLAKAEDGDVVAQIQVAGMYSKGQGVAKNSKEALSWYQKAAEQGNADAQLSLANLYLAGKVIPKNSSEAAKWFKLAATQGRVDAQVQMARMHLSGAGVAKDDIEACKWAILAMAKGDARARQILAFTAPRMTVEQRTKSETLAREFLEKKTSDDATKGIPLVAPPLE